MLLLEVCHAVVQIVHTVGGPGNSQHLCDVDDGAAADSHDAVKVLAAQVVEDGIHHHVGRLAAAKLFLKTGMAAEIQCRNRRIVNIFIRQDQVARAELQLFRQRAKIHVFCNRRYDFEGFHALSLLKYPGNTSRRP